MGDVAVRVERLSKRYMLGIRSSADSTFRDAITGAATRLLGRRSTAAPGPRSAQEFWALRDVSFDVKQGEVVGIIGRNGAGKSTLLKLLSRITEPTHGRITIHGRVSSLLEVGTGFHPELTGRENIFLNGAVLGMSRREIQIKFDEIVDFAEVERFLDTPVKRYSSGMYVRLAFAVAAHLEPEILIVDEVLAVGDSQFQEKCIGKMSDVAARGRTVLFVSHNIDAVKTLCNRAVLLQAGTVRLEGMVADVVTEYLAGMHANASHSPGIWEDTTSGAGVKRLVVIQDGKVTGKIKCGTAFTLAVTLSIDETCTALELGIGFKDEEGRDILRLNNKHLGQHINWPRCGLAEVRVHFPSFNWIHGNSVFVGVYFGYAGGRYFELGEVLSIGLIKQFPNAPTEKIVERVNRIFIDGIEFLT